MDGVIGLPTLQSDVGDWAKDGQFAVGVLGLVMMSISPNDPDVGLAFVIGMAEAGGDSVAHPSAGLLWYVHSLRINSLKVAYPSQLFFVFDGLTLAISFSFVVIVSLLDDFGVTSVGFSIGCDFSRSSFSRFCAVMRHSNTCVL